MAKCKALMGLVVKWLNIKCWAHYVFSWSVEFENVLFISADTETIVNVM